MLRGLGRYVRTAVLKLTVALAYLGGSAYCLLVLGLRDAEVYLTALIATNTAFAVVAVAGSGARPRAWRAALVRPLYRLGGYVTAVAALTGVAFGLDVIFLNHWAAPAEVGVYSVYNGFPKRLLGVLFTDGVGLALLPAMATMDKPELLRRIGRLVPAVALGTAAVAFAASLVFFLLLRAQYPYAVGPDGAVGRRDRRAHRVQPLLGDPAHGRRAGLAAAHRLPGRGHPARARPAGRAHRRLRPVRRADRVRPVQRRPRGHDRGRGRPGVPGRPAGRTGWHASRTAPMKIAYVVNQFPPYVTAGLGRYVERMVPHLDGRHRLAVFTLNDGTLPEHDKRGTVTVHRPRNRLLAALARRRRLNRTRRADFLLLAANVVVSNWRYFLRLRRARGEARPDLVAVHDSTNFLCGLLCHHVLRLPVVLHVHTTEYGVAVQRSIPDPLGLFAAIERWLGWVARRVVVPTPEVRDQLAAAGWDPAKIDVICLGGTFEGRPEVADRAALRDRAARLRARLGIPAIRSAPWRTIHVHHRARQGQAAVPELRAGRESNITGIRASSR